MYQNNIILILKDFYRKNVILSWLLLLSVALFIATTEKFYTIAFFVFVLYLAGSLKSRHFTAAHMLLALLSGALSGMLLYFWWLKGFSGFSLTQLSSALQAGIIAILFAVTAHKPDAKISILTTSLKLSYAALILMILDLLSVNLPQLYLAHLGGLAAGLLIGFSIKTTQTGRWRIYKQQLFSLFRLKPRMKAERGTKRPVTDDEYNHNRVKRQKMIDAILDKISKSGYESLSKEEKELLFSASGKKQ